MMELLTEARILQAIDEACRKTEERWESQLQTKSSQPTIISLRRIFKKEDWELVLASRHVEISRGEVDEVLGIYVSVEERCIGYCTFYLAYSTWDGRVIFLDRLEVFQPEDLESSHTFMTILSLSLSLRYTIADIGRSLECSRFVWQHLADASVPQHVNIQPEVLHGWLTIHMDRDAMVRLAKGSECSLSEGDKVSIDTTIRNCLDGNGEVDHEPPNLHLRLATEHDLEALERLVHGLAHFENMPNAVHATKDHYRRDGFPKPGEGHALFYCILLENADSYACGMAFIYIAHSLSFGRLLYLEDLFIEEEFRGLGGGTTAMEALARICLALNCDKFIWQALDWNTPALNFYANIGGKVQNRLLTYRFAGDALTEFLQHRPLEY